MSKRKWLSPEEFAKAQAAAREARKKTTCAFNNYEDVTQEMVDKFWEKPAYAKNLVGLDNIRFEWKPAYEKAKKNVAMLDYPMSPSYTVHFDREANLKIMIHHGCSWSAQNHLHHYAGKCKDHFKIYTSAWSVVDEGVWELLYDGQKEKKEI